MDGATQIPISEFEARWHNSRVCVWYFQVCKFQFCLLAKYFISAKSCSCSHINFGQPAAEEKLRNRSFAVSEIVHLSGAKAIDRLEYRMRLLPGLLPSDKHAGASLRECTWMNPVFISFCTSLTVDGAILRTWQCYRRLNAIFRNAVGPCMGLSVHVPNFYLKVVFN